MMVCHQSNEKGKDDEVETQKRKKKTEHAALMIKREESRVMTKKKTATAAAAAKEEAGAKFLEQNVFESLCSQLIRDFSLPEKKDEFSSVDFLGLH